MMMLMVMVMMMLLMRQVANWLILCHCDRDVNVNKTYRNAGVEAREKYIEPSGFLFFFSFLGQVYEKLDL